MPPKTFFGRTPARKTESKIGLLVWVALAMAMIALICGLNLQTRRIISLERRLMAQAYEITQLSQDIDTLGLAVNKAGTTSAPAQARNNASATTTPSAADGVLRGLPMSSGTVSPNGQLTRGSLSPDGTKFAGYEDTQLNRRGIAVEIMAQKRVRYVAIFSQGQTTGSGTTFENQMSVRWLDDKTIEYDVLVKVGGAWQKKTETMKIGF